MSAWIESVIDVMTAGGGAMNLSLSDVRLLAPDGRVSWALALAVGLWLLCAWENRWQTHVDEHEFDRGQE